MSTQRNWLGEASVKSKGMFIRPLGAWRSLFGRPSGKNILIKRDAGVYDTVCFIPRLVGRTLDQTKDFAAEIIEPTLMQTCEKLWHWVKQHIRYEKDPDGEESVREPVRLVGDQKGDCDCFTTFLDSALENIRRMTNWKFRIINRITKYDDDNFQHIYPLVITPTGQRIILDCVTDRFNYEEQYSVKQDHPMELRALAGTVSSNDYYYDTATELGRAKKELFNKAGKAIKKAVHSVNRVNPATLLLRTGLLASMKLNIMNVAGRIKYAYHSEEEAKKQGFDMDRYSKLRHVKDRLEKLFYGAGGMPENLREAILTGKGNTKKNLSGLGVIPIHEMNQNGISLSEVIGTDLYERENGLSGLGEPVTASAIAAASAAVAAISKAIKEIGSLRKGHPESDDPDKAGEQIDVKEEESPNNQRGSKDREGETEPASLFQNPLQWVKENPIKTALTALGVGTAAYLIYKSQTDEREPKQSKQSYSSKPQNSTIVREKFTPIPLWNH